jgi:uncharacterized protein YjbI with pentapeptide repeats
VVQALRDAASEHPGHLLPESVRLKPEDLAARLGSLPLLAVGEVLGQPFASAEEAVVAQEAADKRAGRKRDKILAGLREGAVGVERWNGLDPLERRALGGLRKIDLSGCALAGLNLEGIDCDEANFAGADLSKASLGWNRGYATLRQANLTGASLNKAKAGSAVFPEANLEGASLREGDFEHAEFQKANLRSADLTGVRCSRARFQKADLSGANLTGADLSRANLRGTNLSGANLTSTNLSKAEYNASTVFPAGFDPQAAGMVLAGSKAKKPAPAAPPPQNPDFAEFFGKLGTVADAGRIRNALAMLKAERFQLFAEATEEQVLGVVRSQSSAERVYACRLSSAGAFECGTQNLRPCGGLQGSVCKHLLVLVIGLAKSGSLDSGRAFGWLQLAQGQKPTFDKQAMSATFLRYKGAEAGEIDWRPTETLPEDYYNL